MRRHSYHDRSGDEIVELEPGRFFRANGDQVPASEVQPRTSPNYIVGLDEIAVKQRKLSPQFPTLAEAAKRRRHFWQNVVARASIAVAGLAVVTAIVTDTPAIWSGGAIVVAGLTFVATCFVAARMNRHD